MKCEEFTLLLDMPEAERTRQQRQEMDAHMKTCADCALAFSLHSEMRAMDREESVPASFAASWREQIRREEKMEMNRQRFSWKKMLATAAAVVFVAGGTWLSYANGWGLSSPKSAAQSDENRMAQKTETYSYDAGTGSYLMGAMPRMASEEAADTASGREEKIIRTVDMTIRSQRYQQDYEALKALVEETDGRVESLSVSGEGTADSLRRASFTLRIPAGQLDAFVNGANTIGSVSSYSESSEDKSEDYYDVQARLETQLAKMERLQALMGKAATTSELIELESAISDTQYMIDRYTGQLNGYDSRVNDSYVYVTLREITSADAAEEKGLDLGERIINALKASAKTAGELLQSFAVFAITVLPWCLALALLALLVRFVWRRIRKK